MIVVDQDQLLPDEENIFFDVIECIHSYKNKDIEKSSSPKMSFFHITRATSDRQRHSPLQPPVKAALPVMCW